MASVPPSGTGTCPGILPLAPSFALIVLKPAGSKGDPAGFRTAWLAVAYAIFVSPAQL
jgi:uncharacterized membrane protein (GlpM family)